MKGSIISRGKNAWRLRYELPSALEGVRKQASETVHGPKKLAQRVLRERLAALETGNYVSKTRETVGQFMESWISGYAASHVGARTLYGYCGNSARYIVPYLGSLPIQSLQARHVQEFHSWMLDKNLSKQTVVHAHRLLSEALKHAVAWGVIPQNPAAQVPPPRPDTRELEIWDVETLQRFLVVADTTPPAARELPRDLPECPAVARRHGPHEVQAVIADVRLSHEDRVDPDGRGVRRLDLGEYPLVDSPLILATADRLEGAIDNLLDELA